MDQTSMILGWLIGRQLAGQRKATKFETIDASSGVHAVFDPRIATLVLENNTSTNVPDVNYGDGYFYIGSSNLDVTFHGSHLTIQDSNKTTTDTTTTETEVT